MSAFPEIAVGNFTTASRDEIEAVQLARLKWTLQHAYANSPMYQKKFTEAGVHPDDLKTLSDLSKFPYTTKQDLREHYPFNTFAVPMDEVVRIHASSGTTGKPTVVGYTQGDIDRWAEAVARSIQAAGGKRSDKVHVGYGYGLFTGGLGAHYGAEKLGCTVIPFGGGQTERQVQLIEDFKPDIIMVTPSYCLNLADEYERQGLDPAKCSLRIAIFGAEPWTEAMRQEVEQRMGLDAVDIYGLSEIIGPGVAQEFLATKDGPTIWEDYFYPEVINPDSLEVMAEGEPGELVFTALVKEAMPVIRYRTRDLTRLLPGSACNMRRMEKITGRSDDMMIIRGVNVFPSQVEELILKTENLSPYYQLELHRDGNMDSLTVNVEVGSNEVDAAARDKAAADLRRSIKTMIGVSTDVQVKSVNEVPRSQGKAQRVVDLRGA
ncbi:MAG: phenylacetate--CoA ligase PaaK [Thiolinea sp.]